MKKPNNRILTRRHSHLVKQSFRVKRVKLDQLVLEEKIIILKRRRRSQRIGVEQQLNPDLKYPYIVRRISVAGIVFVKLLIEIGAGGTWHGRISYCYGRCTPPSSRPWSLDSSEASQRTSSSSTLLASSPSSSTSSFASLQPIVTLTLTALSTTAISSPFGYTFFSLYSDFLLLFPSS